MWEFCLFAAAGIISEIGLYAPLTDEVKKVFSGERDFSEVFFAMVRDGVLVRFDEKHYMHGKYGRKLWIWRTCYMKKRG